MRRVVLHIEELVLHGVPPEQRNRVADSLRAELTRRLAAPGVAEELVRRGSTDHLRLRTTEIPVAPAARELGVVVATGLASGLTAADRSSR